MIIVKKRNDLKLTPGMAIENITQIVESNHQ
jgi:hypothetical protein